MLGSRNYFSMITVGILALAGTANAFYLPGIAPTDYNPGDTINVLVNSLTSWGTDNYSMTIANLEYYDTHLKYCQPEGGPQSRAGSLGGVLFGDRIQTSSMDLVILKDEACKHLCISHYTQNDLAFITTYIAQGFYHHWSVDGLPVASSDTLFYDDEEVYDDKFPIGTMYMLSDDGPPQFMLYNHYAFEVEYHRTRDDKIRIVGAQVKGVSLEGQTGAAGDEYACATLNMHAIDIENNAPSAIQFTYSVSWRESEVPWATRWDKYLRVYEPEINWFALINTTAMIFFMVFLTGLTLLRLVRKDIAKYNEVDLSEDVADELGWKMIHGDVFRPPKHVMAYSVTVGTGAQIISTVVATLLLALFGLLSPANRGAFSTVLLMLNTVFGAIGGYTSAATYKIWGGQNWKANLMLTPVVVPALVFIGFLCINFLLIFEHAAGAVPIGNMAALFAVWALISLPLSLFCGFLAFKRDWFKTPVRVNQIPRQIPPADWTRSLPFMMVLGGLLPFLAVSLQLYYILSAIWFQRLYYMFGFLFASIVSMLILCIMTTALATYATISAENYHWQWRAFFVSGSPTIYIFVYAIFYMYRYMELRGFMNKLLYFGYTLMASGLCFLALGMVGATSSYFLMRRIYTSIKVD